jgi:type IV pilus assembly protein PilM
LLGRFGHLFQDPPPEFAFELSEAGIAFARNSSTPQIGFRPMEPDVLKVSPVQDNIQKPDFLAAHLGKIVEQNGSRKRRKVAVILPDFAARVSVLDFDSFPSNPQEQASLVRFRVKKTVPFDVDAAAVAFRIQPAGGKRVDVVTAVIALEIVGRYEAIFRQLNLHAGYVTTSLLSSLDLVKAGGLTVVAKRTGMVLSVAIMDGNQLRLVRTVELQGFDADAVLGVLFPTFAFVEDEWKRRPERLLACGFGRNAESIRAACELELGVMAEPLRSRLEAPDENNAGLLGYLESVREA